MSCHLLPQRIIDQLYILFSFSFTILQQHVYKNYFSSSPLLQKMNIKKMIIANELIIPMTIYKLTNIQIYTYN